jgi:hypothetical protein
VAAALFKCRGPLLTALLIYVWVVGVGCVGGTPFCV